MSADSIGRQWHGPKYIRTENRHENTHTANTATLRLLLRDCDTAKIHGCYVVLL